MSSINRLLSMLCIITPCLVSTRFLPPLNSKDTAALGKQIWHNECGGSYDKLVWWNEGETFASVGIGHFLWIPQNSAVPFTQTFHELLEFMKHRTNRTPAWLKGNKPICPWTHRSQLIDGIDPRLYELRDFLQATVYLQAEFIVTRCEQILKKLIHKTPRTQRAMLKNKIKLVAATPQGVYALVDYINFKGDGTNEHERYAGKGWGLLQLLIAMDDVATFVDPCAAFACAAEKVLTERVRNAPPERHEQRWLTGWLNRVKTYVSLTNAYKNSCAIVL